ncbi:MAG TPA: hypothetical protein VNQ76_23165 [Planctomicrobium sp.]|nr:hypothetical protein [Planctomicrobium sp.]
MTIPEQRPDEEQTVNISSSSPRGIAVRLLFSLIVSVLIAVGGFLGAYAILEHRDLTLARQEVVEYSQQKSRERVETLLMNPAIHELEVLVADDDTRVLIRAEVDDMKAERLILDAFEDVRMERFEPVWEIHLRIPPDDSLPKPVIIPSIGVVRAYSVRATLAAGVAGILFTVVFSTLMFVTLRKAIS